MATDDEDEELTRLTESISDIMTGLAAVEMSRGNKDGREMVATASLNSALELLHEMGFSLERVQELVSSSFREIQHDLGAPLQTTTPAN